MIYYILSILGISPWEYLHWLIAITITLLLLDIFLQVEIPSFLAIILLADYINSLLFLFFANSVVYRFLYNHIDFNVGIISVFLEKDNFTFFNQNVVKKYYQRK